MNAISFDIATLLAANALGTFGTDLFAMEWGTLGDGEVDAQTLIIDTGGLDTPLKNTYEQPTFQVLVRGAKGESMKTAYDKLRTIHEFLIAQPVETITNTLGLEPLSSLVGLGRDDNDRAVFSMNYFTHRNAT